MGSPTTAAGRALEPRLHLLAAMVQNGSNIARQQTQDTADILAIEAEAREQGMVDEAANCAAHNEAARATVLDALVAEVERLTTWPRVSYFAYDAKVRGEIVNPTEDIVVVERAAVLAIIKQYRDDRS